MAERKSILERLAVLEQRIELPQAVQPHADIDAMTDAECADEWRRICHARQPTDQPLPYAPAEEAEIVRLWRAMRATE